MIDTHDVMFFVSEYGDTHMIKNFLHPLYGAGLDRGLYLRWLIISFKQASALCSKAGRDEIGPVAVGRRPRRQTGKKVSWQFQRTKKKTRQHKRGLCSQMLFKNYVSVFRKAHQQSFSNIPE